MTRALTNPDVMAKAIDRAIAKMFEGFRSGGVGRPGAGTGENPHRRLPPPPDTRAEAEVHTFLYRLVRSGRPTCGESREGLREVQP
jgi:hypothetical protein